jgi:hypothetical protein
MISDYVRKEVIETLFKALIAKLGLLTHLPEHSPGYR